MRTRLRPASFFSMSLMEAWISSSVKPFLKGTGLSSITTHLVSGESSIPFSSSWEGWVGGTGLSGAGKGGGEGSSSGCGSTPSILSPSLKSSSWVSTTASSGMVISGSEPMSPTSTSSPDSTSSSGCRSGSWKCCWIGSCKHGALRLW